MADNVPVTPGTGADIATDDVGGVHFQRVKLDLGAGGASSPVEGVVPVVLMPPVGLVCKLAQYTATQTGTALWTPASGKKVVVTSYQIQAFGSSAGDVILWFGASGDTTFSPDPAVFYGSFVPSTSVRPGVVQSGFWYAAIDDVLRVTSTNNIDFNVNVWGYEV